MDDLLAEFIAETHEMLGAVQETLVSWEANPSDSEKLDVIFRFVHTVKGNCGFFDLPRLAALSHAAETSLAEVRAGNRQPDKPFIDAILAVIDRIEEMVSALEAGEDLPSGSDDDVLAALDGSAGSVEQPETAQSETPSAPEPEAAKPTETTQVARSIRLPVTLLDRVMAEISDVVLVRNELSRHIRKADLDPALVSTFDRLTGIINDLREDVSQMRMHRLDHLYAPLPRLVRDLSHDLGKKVALEVDGGQVELDREIIELIRDPIVHILRNAIDHGIEAPDVRVANQKPETGTISINTRQTGNHVAIIIDDDGAGINVDRLVKRAKDAGIVTAEELQVMSEAHKLELIFEPGISTAAEVTSISGRGVGMDVARANIERLGGTIAIRSEEGEGTRLIISLPATLSIVPSLTVQVGDHRFGVPRSYAEEIVSSRSDRLSFCDAGDSKLVEFRGKKLRCIRLADVLGIAGDDTTQCDLLIAKLASGDLCALAVDKVLDHEELVVKPLADAIMSCNLYTGASLLDDGSLVLMLHVTGIAMQEGLHTDVARKKRSNVQEQASKAADKLAIPAVLFSTLEGTAQLVRMDSVTRIAKVDRTAFRFGEASAQVVINGDIVPLYGSESAHLCADKANVLLLGDGKREIAYLIDKVLDTVRLTNEIMPESQAGLVEGVVLLDGMATEVVDCHWLFANYGTQQTDDTVRTCRMDLTDQWVRSILRPLVESAGYKVIDGDASEDADLAIMLEGGESAPLQAAEIITLMSAEDEAEGGADSIYRYDRDGLIAALQSKKRASV